MTDTKTEILDTLKQRLDGFTLGEGEWEIIEQALDKVREKQKALIIQGLKQMIIPEEDLQQFKNKENSPENILKVVSIACDKRQNAVVENITESLK